MADNEHGARVVRQELLQQFERLGVEVVRRLVEDEHVGGLEEESREQQSRSLAAGEKAYRNTGPLRREEEVLQVAMHMTGPPVDRDPVVAVCHGVDHGAVGVEPLARLIEVDNLQPRTGADLSRGRLELAQQAADERGLSAAIRPDDADAVAPHDEGGELVDQRRAALVAEAQRLGLTDQLARIRGLLDGHLELARSLALRGTNSAELLERAETADRLGPARRHTLARPFGLFGDALVEPDAHGLLFCQLPLTPLQIGAVAAIPRGQLAAVELDDAVGNPLQEGPVVGHKEEPALRLAQEQRLELLDGLHVEVIRGLVEQQNVGVGRQRTGQCGAPLEAARECREGLVGVETEPCDGRLDRRSNRPGRRGISDRIAAGPHRCCVAAGASEGTRHQLPDRGRVVRRDLLDQPCNAQCVGPLHHALLGQQHTLNHAEQRGLSRAIPAQQPDPLTSLYREGGIVQHGCRAKGEMNPPELNQCHYTPLVSPNILASSS